MSRRATFRAACAFWALLAVLLELFCCCSSRPAGGTATQPRLNVLVLDKTVEPQGTWRVGQPPGASSVSTTVVDCSRLKGKPAYRVRQATLVMESVVLANCSHQAIELIGPGAVLRARHVVFSNHGSSSSTVQGIVISALKAAVTLEDVVITNSSGYLPSHKDYNPPCDSSSLKATDSMDPAAACGAPVLTSSLIHLQDSTLTASNTRVSDNTAAALISTAGSAKHRLQLQSGAVLQGNHARWLLVADSFAADQRGREILLAPQPSEQRAAEGVNVFVPLYTTHDIMGAVKNMTQGARQLQGFVRKPVVQQYVGTAPKGQSPLQVLLQRASFSNNTVTEGLMWLRLVNTSMDTVALTDNAAAGALFVEAAAGQSGAELAAAARRSPSRLQPPRLCDMAVLEQALIKVHGPAAFDVFRSDISNNFHPQGAILRVTDGMSLTSIRSSTLRSNVATAVLRFEGRTWVHNLASFMSATQALDSDFYKLVENTSPGAYKLYQLTNYLTQQGVKDAASTDATSFVTNSTFGNNAVFHAVLLSRGDRLDWRSYEKRKSDAESRAGKGAAAKVTMDTYSVVNWWIGNTFLHNTWIQPDDTSSISRVDIDPSAYGNALGVVLSASFETRKEWQPNGTSDITRCEAAVRDGMQEKSPKDYNLRPSVVCATFAQNFFYGKFSFNSGFQHVASVQYTTTVASLDIRHNSAKSSFLRMVDSDVQVYDTTITHNQVHSGSVLLGDTIVGRLHQVSLSHNTAVNSSSSAAASPTGSPLSHNTSQGTSDSNAPQAAALPVMNLVRLYLGSLSGITISSNAGRLWGFALKLSEFNLLEPMTAIRVLNNTASGIGLLSMLPWYDEQSIELKNVSVTENQVSTEGGALLISGFSSRAGKTMRVLVDRCVFENNRPTPGNQAPPQGGGIALQAPPEDKADGGSCNALGFLSKLTITIVDTLIAGNTAAEGGGLWSAWPMTIKDCTIRGNTATSAGGGLFLRGLQAYTLGRAYSTVSDSVVSNNKAGFGGAVACDSCRAFFYSTHMSSNKAISMPQTTADSSDCGACAAGSLDSNTTCAAACGLLQKASSFPAIPGVGGAVAAVFRDDSFLRVCGSSAGQPVRMTNNHADMFGGLVHMTYQGRGCKGTCSTAQASGCGVAQGQPQPCGLQLHHVDWSGTRANHTGHVLSWAATGQLRGFGMHCATKAASNGNAMLPEASISGSCGCGALFQRAHLSGAAPTHSLTFELPNQLTVFNTTCLEHAQRRGGGSGNPWQQCAVASSLSGKAATKAGVGDRVLRAFAGHAVNLTVGLGGQQELPIKAFETPCDKSSSTTAVSSTLSTGRFGASVRLEQSSDGQLFVIGPPSAPLSSDWLATFCNLALQPIYAPTRNQRYKFSIKVDGSGHLLQVPPATVTVELRRCTLGQRMLINRCVPCAQAGTFSLDPSHDCQPCVPGALCSGGLLQPQEGFWSPNPFVPQVTPCLLRGACANRSISRQQLQALVPWAKQPVSESDMQWPHAAARPGNASARRLLLQPPGNRGSRSNSSRSGSLPRLGGSMGSDDVNHTRALMMYNQWLAERMADDPGSVANGEPLLADVPYQQLLDTWRQVQCSPGYKGHMCSSCDASYKNPADQGATPRRFALHRNKCVECSESTAGTWALLVVFSLLFFVYMAVVVYAQVKSVDKAVLHGDSVDSSASAAPLWQRCLGYTTPKADVGAAAADSAAAPELQADQSRCDATVCIGSNPSAAGQGSHYILGLQTGGGPPPEYASPFDAAPATAGSSGGAAAAGGAGGGVHGTSAAAGAAQQQVGAAAGGQKARQQSSGVRTLVAMWKVLTSYAQIVAMVRFIPTLWDTTSSQPLAFTDLSGFTQFIALDCILPGPADRIAYTRVLMQAFGVPVLLFLAFLLAWIVVWALKRASAKLHASVMSDASKTSAHSSTCSAIGPGLPSSTTSSAAGSKGFRVMGAATASSASESRQASATSSAATDRGPSNSSMTWLKSAASSVAQRVPAGLLRKLVATEQPVPLGKYLGVRLIITTVVLGYSCYSLFTSSMLQTLACYSIHEVASLEGAAYGPGTLIREFGQLHYQWLSRRLGQLPPSGWQAAEGTRPCHPGSAGDGGGICQLTGSYWKQDYSVQCFSGDHQAVAAVGGVFLALVGILLPVLCGFLLWCNKHRLREASFSARYSFMYHEYKARVCYWEFAIMARKLAFLAVFVALTPPLASPELVALLQLLTAAVLAVAVLLLNVVLQPFKDKQLNHLECAALTAITLTFLLLGASVTVSTSYGGRVALLVITGAMNAVLICYFLWQIGRLAWQEFGQKVVHSLWKRMGVSARHWRGTPARVRAKKRRRTAPAG